MFLNFCGNPAETTLVLYAICTKILCMLIYFQHVQLLTQMFVLCQDGVPQHTIAGAECKMLLVCTHVKVRTGWKYHVAAQIKIKQGLLQQFL